jgi:hypothetical protein
LPSVFDFVELVAKDYPFPRGLASLDIATERTFEDARLRTKLRVEYWCMSPTESASLAATQTQLEEQLGEVENRLLSEMRARGFDPAQGENLALTGPLAELYMERERLREQLDTLIENNSNAG